jgi:hypothetical protein
MKVHIIRSSEYNVSDFKEVINLLKTHTNSIKISDYSNYEFEYSSSEMVKTWDEFFKVCDDFRKSKKISRHDYVFLLTENKNREDYFGWTNEKLGNYFIQTSDWNQYFDQEINKHFPISYEVVAWILRSLMYDTQEEILDNTHERARGCVMDFCDEKTDIVLKMRTGDVCLSCLQRIKERKINQGFLGNIFNAMENIRKGLMYRERNEQLGIVSPLSIKLGVNRPKFILTEMNDLVLNFDDSETTIYLTILQLGGIQIKNLIDFENEILKNYRLVKNGSQLDIEMVKAVHEWVNPLDSSLFTQKVSKINGKLKKLLGDSLSKKYKITNYKGKYKIDLSKSNVSIEGFNSL